MTTKKLTRRALLARAVQSALALTFSAWGFGRIQARGQEEIVIGHQAPLTGAVARFGQWHNRALQAAVERLNARGGLAGRPVRLATEDGASNPETGQEAFKKLVLQQGAAFVIGSVWSGTNLATAPLARELKTPYFPQGIATEIVGPSGNRYVFKSYHTVRAAVTAGARWAVDNLGRRWTIVASQIEFAQSQAQDWQAQLTTLGAELVDVITVPFRPTDFLPYVSQIDLKRTEVLYHAFTAVDTVRFLQTAYELGIQERVKLLGLIEGIDVLDTADLAFEGTYYITGYPRLADQVPEELQPFDRVYREAVGIDAEGRAADGSVVPIADLFGSWQALSLIERAVEESGWRSPRGHPALIEALEGLAWEPSEGFPQGPGFLRPQDHLAFHDHYIERVEEGRLTVLLRIPKERSLYEPLIDYTTQEL
jgi:branched-chain amino acid transport system substrate-binding protein